MKPFQVVKLNTDKYVSEGFKVGDIGCILEDYDGEIFEVEFSDKDGMIIALHTFHKDELEFCDDIQEIEINEDSITYQINDVDLANIKSEREATEKRIKQKRRKKQVVSCCLEVTFFLICFGVCFYRGFSRSYVPYYLLCIGWLSIAVYRLYRCHPQIMEIQ